MAAPFCAAQDEGESALAVRQLSDWLAGQEGVPPSIATQTFTAIPLTKPDALLARRLLSDSHRARVRRERADEFKSKVVRRDSLEMKYDYREFGEPPARGHSLFISLHGGGSSPPEVNEQQWRNQIRLYQPAEGIYLAPRAPTDAWNMWHQAHMDGLIIQLIEDCVVFLGVNPDRVYLMGYSAGGDGVYQLAPRLADRFAAAAMMAGHPNEASPLGLRNLPFIIQVGAQDSAFGRNDIAKRWARQLDELQEADPDGYPHELKVHEGKGHWMDREDALAVPWMLQFTRNPCPARVVWFQDDVTRTSFYWLAVDAANQVAGSEIHAEKKEQSVELTAEKIEQVIVRIDDRLFNMDQPIRVVVNQQPVFSGHVSRTIATLAKTLRETGDPQLMFDGEIEVGVPAREAAPSPSGGGASN